MRCGMQQQIFRRTKRHYFTTCITALGTQIDEPIRRTDHIQVVLDHQQRMPRIQQLAQGTHQLGDVVKVQAGGGLVQHEQGAAPRHGLAAGSAALGGFGQEAGQLQTLGFTARQRGHRLTQFHIFQPHIHDGL